MSTAHVVVETDASSSVRARQVSSMFDVPHSPRSRLEWDVEVPAVEDAWNVGLIVGPSGSGKTSVMRHVYGEPAELAWGAASVVDDFAKSLSVQAITEACSSVGFNTIPAWLRPFAVLSNGERFRVDLARRLLELPDPVVVDEFTSVVDRQVAKIGAHAVQKYVRKAGRKFVAVTCHYDVIDWLQPDWVLDMATQSFTRRLLQRRPPLDAVVGRVPYAAWRKFAPYHYLSADLHRSARCFGLWCGGELVAFCGVMHRVHPRVRDIMGVSRVVTLPDWQGLGIAFVLLDSIGAAYKATGRRFHNYPAHPSFVRAHDRSPLWKLEKAPGVFSGAQGRGTSRRGSSKQRPCAVFSYQGPALDREAALRVLGS